MSELEKVLTQRLQEIKARIDTAASNAGRESAEIKLLAVSKNHPLEKITILRRLGIEVFAESRVQEVLEKDERESELNWHFIGHLQRNKVKYLLRMENCLLIHSLDSWRLAKEINKRAAKNGRIMPVLLEVNVADERNKYGIKSESVEEFLQKAQQLDNIKITGLMTIAPHVDDPETVRPIFKKLAQIREEMKIEGFQLEELSMGMSNDFEVAIEEGATIVRIGSALFGQRGA